jgi:hypothetical protein
MKKGLVALLLAITAALAFASPSLRRYVKIEKM